MTLTEQWKKGELEAGWYYITTTFTDEVLMEWFDGYEFRTVFTCNVKQILAPVPSYEEWMRTKYSLDDYKRLCDMRGKIIDKMDESHEDTVKHLRQENAQLRKFLKEFNALDVAKENQQLKELLYKCREKLDWLNGGYDVWGGELTDFIEEIDNTKGAIR